MSDARVKPLVWRETNDGNRRKGECFSTRSPVSFAPIAAHKKHDGWWLNVDCKTYPTLDAAKAAAQADYEARILAALEPAPDVADVAELTDPVAVHANMLRGTVAKPTVEQIIHLYGLDALVKALAPLIVREAGNERPDALAAIARMGAWSGAGRVGGMYEHPGYRKPYPIQTVLRDLASQEGCDGEPYDAMVFAASYIDCIIAHIAALTAQVKALQDDLNGMASEGRRMRGEYNIAADHLAKAEAERDALRAKVARLEGAGDFARLIGNDAGKDDKDTVLVSYGMLRRLRAALTDGGKDG